jgi:hypothetical protein
MPVSPANALISSLSRWFQREPVVGVAAFGKSGVVNGHQAVAGDSTKGIVETARCLYYEGALPNCPAWASQLASQERLLARFAIRWARRRTFICVLSPVAEGGSPLPGFAPFISCVEMDASRVLNLMEKAASGLRSLEAQLLTARPETWPDILTPLRASLTAAVEAGDASRSAEAQLGEAAAIAGAGLAPLGADLGIWVRSLAEELGLPLSPPDGRGSRRELIVTGCRVADAPRLSADPLGDLRTWAAVLDSAGVGGAERWLITGPGMAAVRILVGQPRARFFDMLWQTNERAGVGPTPIAGSRSATLRESIAAWLGAVGLWNDEIGQRLDVAPSTLEPTSGPDELPAAAESVEGCASEDVSNGDAAPAGDVTGDDSPPIDEAADVGGIDTTPQSD